MNKDQLKGRAKMASGKVKEATGKALGNGSLRARGMAEKAVGRIQKSLGDARSEAKKTH